MERSRLKNIIILILLLLNVCLLISLLHRLGTQRETRLQTQQQLVELFGANGVILREKAISTQTPPTGLSLSQTPQENRDLAALFLGSALTATEQGGGIYTYGSSAGAALFHENGSFDIIGTQITADAEAFCDSFCKKNQYQNRIEALDDTGSGTVSAIRSYNGYPVFNCSIVFTLENHALTKVSGTYLSETAAETTSDSPLSSTAALTAFLEMRRETGAVASEITDMYPCYELQSTAAAPATLVPAWCIVTEMANYYVNCYTGAVTLN